jgi:hypothetical protein
MLELFRRDVRLTSAQPLREMRRLLPAHPEHVAHAEVGNLDVPLRIEEEVLRLDVAVSNTHAVEVSDTGEDLLEVRVDLGGSEVAFLDRRVKVAAGTILHHFAPMLLLVLNEVDGLDDVVALTRKDEK